MKIQSGLLIGIGGLLIGFGAIRLAKKLKSKGKRESMRKDKAKKKGENKEPLKAFGYEIVDECPNCGEDVKPYERQELWFDTEEDKWYRMCEECMNEAKKSKKIEVRREARDETKNSE